MFTLSCIDTFAESVCHGIFVWKKSVDIFTLSVPNERRRPTGRLSASLPGRDEPDPRGEARRIVETTTDGGRESKDGRTRLMRCSGNPRLIEGRAIAGPLETFAYHQNYLLFCAIATKLADHSRVPGIPPLAFFT